MRRRSAISGLLLFTALLCACSPKPVTAKNTPSYSFEVITHSDGTDNFWPVVKNGAMAAAAKMGVRVSYTYNQDPLKQSQLIDDAIAQKADGIVVSMANPDALRASIEKAERAGIPVVTINSGAVKSKEFGALAHVGQDEQVAGQGAGERLDRAGVRHVLCLIHEAGNIDLNARCKGAAAGLVHGRVTSLQVNGANLSDIQSTVRAKLQADPTIDGVLALNPGVASAALPAVKESGTKVRLATFDLSKDVVESIEDGDILFAVDQQQYLQGFLPIVLLTLYKTNLNVVGGGKPILTGPGFVTKENAARVRDLAAKGDR